MTFAPQARIISGITNANPAVVTVTEEYDYLAGSYVRLVFYDDYGMPELNEQVYLLTPIDETTFSIDVDTSNMGAFSVGSSDQDPQVIPVGEVASTLQNATRNTLVQN